MSDLVKQVEKAIEAAKFVMLENGFGAHTTDRFFDEHGAAILAAAKLADFATRGGHRRFILNSDNEFVVAYLAATKPEKV